MSTLIHERVEMAQRGENPFLICKMHSGWAVIGDVQPLDGYCLLLADPVVKSINDLSAEERARFSEDMYRIGDALLKHTESYRINYEILGNSEAALHAHIIPRYMSEPDEKRSGPAWCNYNWGESRPYDENLDSELVKKLRAELSL